MSRRGRYCLLAAVSALVAAAGCYILLDRTYLGQLFENSSYLGAERSQLHFGPAAFDHAHLIAIVSFAIVGLLLAALAVRRRQARLGIALAVISGLSILFSESAKFWWLPRPGLGRVAPFAPSSASFPSGHVTAATAAALTLILLVPARRRSVAAVVSGVYLIGMATYVQAVPWHRPSDVIGGALIAWVGFVVALPVLPRLGWTAEGEARLSRAAVTVVVVTAGVAASAAIWSAVRVAWWLSKPYHDVAVSTNVPRLAFLDAWIVTSSVLALMVMAFLVVAGRIASGPEDSAVPLLIEGTRVTGGTEARSRTR